MDLPLQIPWTAGLPEQGREMQRPVVYKMDAGFLGRPKANGNQVAGDFDMGRSIEYEQE